MVEGEGGEVVEGVPLLRRWRRRRLGVLGVLGCVGEVGERDGVASRVAAGFAVEACLVEGEAGEVGFFFQFACDGVGGVFVLVDEATREGPLAGEGFVLSLNEEDVGRVLLWARARWRLR